VQSLDAGISKADALRPFGFFRSVLSAVGAKSLLKHRLLLPKNAGKLRDLAMRFQLCVGVFTVMCVGLMGFWHVGRWTMRGRRSSPQRPCFGRCSPSSLSLGKVR
jgi:hypothetical protein